MVVGAEELVFLLPKFVQLAQNLDLRLETAPAPAAHRQTNRDPSITRRVGEHLLHRAGGQRREAVTESMAVGKPGMGGSLHEAGDEASPKVVAGAGAGVDFEH